MRIAAGVLMILGGIGNGLWREVAAELILENLVFVSPILTLILLILTWAIVFIPIIGAYFTFRRRRWKLSLACAICSVAGWPFIPGLLAVVFLAIRKGEFQEPPASQPPIWHEDNESSGEKDRMSKGKLAAIITGCFVVTAVVITLVVLRPGHTPEPKHHLTISSTSGGSVVIPDEGTVARARGTVVNLVAQAERGYRFVSWTGDVGNVANVNAAITGIIVENDHSVTANFEPGFRPMVAAGKAHTVGLRSDGTVIAAGSDKAGQCRINDWTDIIQVSAGEEHTVGLKSNGTVAATGDNSWGQCDVGHWRTVIQAAAGQYNTVGLQSGGTLVSVGAEIFGQNRVDGWRNIIQVAPGVSHTVGLRSDGRVVAVGMDTMGQCDVRRWREVIQISAGVVHTVGLRWDGTVVSTGGNAFGQRDIDDWYDIIQVAAGGSHTVGLRSDGTVVAAGSNWAGQCDVGDWRDIVQIDANSDHTVGLRSDGSVVAVGNNDYGQCDVGGWNLNP